MTRISLLVIPVLALAAFGPTAAADAGSAARVRVLPFEDAEENRKRWEQLLSDPAAYERAIAQALGIPDFPEPPSAALTDAPGNRWISIGSGIHNPQATPENTKHFAGRVTSAKYAFDVEQGQKVLWAGASSGGLWKFRGFGIFGTWSPVSANLPGSPSVGDFLVHESGPEKILVGTGDPHRYPAGGLWRSGNAGRTWTRTDIEWRFGGWSPPFFKLAADRGNPDVVLGATSGGILRSTDFGVAPVAWPFTGAEVTDIVQDPGNPQRWLAARRGFGVLESLDGGSSWAPIGGTGGAGLDDPKDRISLAVCEASPNYVYAIVSGEWRCTDGSSWDRTTSCTPSGGGCPSGWTCQSAYMAGDLSGIYRSSDGGSSFQRIDPIDLISWTQAFHTTSIAVDPDDCDRVIVGMTSAQMTSNATVADPADVLWRRESSTLCDTDGDGRPDVPQTSSCDLRVGHADHTGFLFVPDEIEPGSNEVVDASDGGVFFYDHQLNTVDGQINKLGLIVSQTMNATGTLAGSYTDTDLLLAGMQDNGMVRIDKGASQKLVHVGGGDGGASDISPVDPTRQQFSSGAPYVRFYADGDDPWVNVQCSMGNLANVTVMTDPTPGFAANPTLFTHTTTDVFQKPRSPACDWGPVGPFAVPNGFNVKQLDMAHEPGGRVFYISATNDGRVFVLDPFTATSAWEDRTPYGKLPPDSEMKDAIIAADRSSAQPGTLYYVTRWSRPSAALISTNRGKDWRDVTGDLSWKLPDADYWELIGNPADLRELFLMTNVGVFRTANGLDPSPTWYRYMRGLPSVVMVPQVEVNLDNSPTGRPVMHIGTYGWGFWERDVLSPYGGHIPGTEGVLEGRPLEVVKVDLDGTEPDLRITWGPSCSPGDSDYALYEGVLGDFASHMPYLCSTNGQTEATITPSPGDRYYLVAPTAIHDQVQTQGSLGFQSGGQERPPGVQSCFQVEIGGCP